VSGSVYKTWDELEADMAPLPVHTRIENYVRRLYRSARSIPRNIKWFYQRGKRGYSDCDVWSLDYYLSSWMPEAIRRLSKLPHGGHPTTMCDEPLSCCDGCPGQERWESILSDIADAFEVARKTGGWTLTPDERGRFDKGMKLFTEYYFGLWN